MTASENVLYLHAPTDIKPDLKFLHAFLSTTQSITAIADINSFAKILSP